MTVDQCLTLVRKSVEGVRDDHGGRFYTIHKDTLAEIVRLAYSAGQESQARHTLDTLAGAEVIA